MSTLLPLIIISATMFYSSKFQSKSKAPILLLKHFYIHFLINTNFNSNLELVKVMDVEFSSRNTIIKEFPSPQR